MDFSCKISKRRRSHNHDSNPFFNCNSFRTHQVGTPTSNLPNLVGHFTFHTAFISRQKWTKNAYLCQIFLPKRGQLSPFCIRIAWQHRSLPKIWILPPCFDSDGQSVAADESGVVNLLILGISCSFTGTLPYQNERAVAPTDFMIRGKNYFSQSKRKYIKYIFTIFLILP